MAVCNNCGVKLGCTCKRRTASDGKSCCASCVGNYQKKLKFPTKSSSTSPGVILNVTAVQTN